MKQLDTLAAAGGNVALREALDEIQGTIRGLQEVLAPPSSTGSASASSKPQTCQFDVSGEDGNFVIDIRNPTERRFNTVIQKTNYYELYNKFQASFLSKIYPGKPVQVAEDVEIPFTHQLRCSLNLSFDASGDVRTYGPDKKVHWVITDLPNENRYWQLRSSADGVTWNAWVDYRDPLICGAVPVWSGRVRSARMMPNVAPNTTGYATVVGVLNGAVADIEVYGDGGVGTPWYWGIGENIEGPYPSATLPGYALDTSYFVFYDADNELFRVFTAAQYAQSLPDRFRFAGAVHTPKADGSGGIEGGGGPTGGGGGDPRGGFLPPEGAS